MTAAGCRALLIGNSTFPEDPHNLPELKGPVNDLPLLRDALTDPDLGVFEPFHVRLLPERSKREITTAMEAFFRQASIDDLVLLYYSGHGQRDEYDSLYLCARDTRADLLLSTAISDAEINGMMRTCPARTFVVILDCCYSGSFKGGGLPATLRGAGRFLITSSRPSQLSIDAEDVSGPSAFTRHLVTALTLGTLDPNHDGYVSLNDIYDYVLGKLQEETKQIPQRHFDHAIGDVALARAPIQPAQADEPRRTSHGQAQLEVSESAIDLRGVQPGETIPAEIIDVFNRGEGDLDWIAECDADWIQVESFPTFLRLTFHPHSGVNRANVRVRDRGGGGSKTIRVTIEVLPEEQPPRLELSTTELDFGSLSRGSESPSLSVRLTNRGGGQLNARVSTADSWILLQRFAEDVSVVVTTSEMGDHHGNILVSSDGGEGRVHVHVRVERGPVVVVSPHIVDFGDVVAGTHLSRFVAVRNGGTGALSWECGQSSAFFAATPVHGGIEVRLRSHAPGLWVGSIWVRSNGGQATVEVRAAIRLPRLIQPAPSARRVTDGGRRRQRTVWRWGAPVAAVAAIAALAVGVLVQTGWVTFPFLPGRWSAVTSMAVTRTGHQAMLLKDGSVLVTGGSPGGPTFGGLRSAEVYTPSSNSWRPVADMPSAHTDHVAVLLRSGQVLVAGGGDQAGKGITLTSEVFDPGSGKWQSTGHLMAPVTRGAAALLADGRVLLVGSGTPEAPEAEVYDPATRTWSATTRPVLPCTAEPDHPCGISATILHDKRVLVVRGWSAALYDLGKRPVWVPLPPLRVARTEHTATMLTDGRVLVVGGWAGTLDAEVYSPELNRWASAGHTLFTRRHHSATLLPDGDVLVAGGEYWPGRSLMAERYRPSRGTWAAAGPMHSMRPGHAAVALPSGAVLVTGGIQTDPSSGIPNQARAAIRDSELYRQ